MEEVAANLKEEELQLQVVHEQELQGISLATNLAVKSQNGSNLGGGVSGASGSSSSFQDDPGIVQSVRNAIQEVAKVAAHKFVVVSDGSNAIRAMGKFVRNRAGSSKIPPKHGSLRPS